jgi:hypothetical protein
VVSLHTSELMGSSGFEMDSGMFLDKNNSQPRSYARGQNWNTFELD